MPKAKKIIDKINKERDLIASKNARDILEIIGESKLPSGDLKKGDYDEYKKLAERVMDYMLEHNTKFWDVNYIFQHIKQILGQAEQMVSVNLDLHYKKAVRKLFNDKEDIDVTINDIDRVLKS